MDTKLLPRPLFDDDGLLFDKSYNDGDKLPGIIVEDVVTTEILSPLFDSYDVVYTMTSECDSYNAVVFIIENILL